MQNAKLDIDVDVKILKQRFGQNFIICIKVVDFSFYTFDAWVRRAFLH